MTVAFEIHKKAQPVLAGILFNKNRQIKSSKTKNWETTYTAGINSLNQSTSRNKSDH
jgi:hypothetical protein